MSRSPREAVGRGVSSDGAGRLPLRVALVSLYHAQGNPARGLSYEYNNFFPTLRGLFEDTLFFDFHTPFVRHGRERMNEEVLGLLRKERPDLTIIPLFVEEFSPETLEEMRSYTTTLAYLFDDNWRGEFAERYVRHFDYFTTPHTWTERLWREKGYGNVIYSPFGFDHHTYVSQNASTEYPVSFVGGFHPYRAWLLKRLRKAGVDVAVWGNAWPAGVLSQSEMIGVFNRSKINLNLTSSVSWDLRYLLSGHWPVRNLVRSRKRGEQLKGRHFEIPACGGFQLTYYTEDLEKHFEISREVALYHDDEDLIDKVRYFLRNEEERAEIARAGHERAVRDHSYDRRFRDIVRHIDRTGWHPSATRRGEMGVPK